MATRWMTPSRCTGTVDADADAELPPGTAGPVGLMVARQPGLQATLRSRVVAPAAWTVICWVPSDPGAPAVTDVPDAGAPPGPPAHAQPRGSAFWKTPKDPMVPENLQCGQVTPYCMRPRRATSPASAVRAVGTPTVAAGSAWFSITSPAARTGAGGATRSDRLAVDPVATTSADGSHRIPPVAVSTPALQPDGVPPGTGTAQLATVSRPPKYQRCACPGRRVTGGGSGVGAELYRLRSAGNGVEVTGAGAAPADAPAPPLTGVTK